MQAAKKCQNHHPPQLLPTFATLVSQPIQHDQSWTGSTTIILRICVLYTTFSSRAAETHFICGSLLLGGCFFCNGFRSGFLAMELTAPMSSSASWASSCNSTSTHHCTILHLHRIPWSFCWKSHSRKSTVLLQIHHKATSQSCLIMKKTNIKIFRGLLITLAAALSGTASGTSVASASASLRDRSHSQRVLSWFQHVSSNGMHCHWPDTCLPATPKNRRGTCHL